MTLKNTLSIEQEEYIGRRLEQSFFCQREKGGRNDWEEHFQVMGTFWGDGNILYLEADLGYTEVCIYQNSANVRVNLIQKNYKQILNFS